MRCIGKGVGGSTPTPGFPVSQSSRYRYRLHYLVVQAKQNPAPFLALLGKVLPTQVSGEDEKDIRVVIRQIVETVEENDLKLIEHDDGGDEA